MRKSEFYSLVAELHRHGLTQAMVARLLGYSRTHVMRIFRELGIPSPRQYRTVADAFKALPSELQAKVREARSM